MNFNYLGIPQCDQASSQQALNPLNGSADCLSAVGPVPGAFATTRRLRTDANTAFGEDVQRGYKQKAFFTSIDVDIIPKVLTATGGIRFYHYDEFEEGSEYYSESTSGASRMECLRPEAAWSSITSMVRVRPRACAASRSISSKSESGHRWRGNLTWHVTDDVMSYYTYSEGFRPGGFNRTNSLPGQAPSLAGVAPYSCAVPIVVVNGVATCPKKGTDLQFNKPAGYESDQLINQEIGIKSEWLDHRLIVQPVRLRHALEQRAAAVVRPGAPGQYDLRRQWSRSTRSRASRCSSSPGSDRRASRSRDRAR